MTTMYYQKDAKPELLKAKKIAILGYGSQGHAHALNLHDSGYDVRVGLRMESSSVDKAEEAGLRVLSIAEACAEADVIMVLVPDTEQKRTYDADIAPHLTSGKCLLFAHGFNIRFGLIKPPSDVDVAANTGASIVDVNTGSVTMMLAGTPGACDQLEKALEVFSGVELQRTGRVALPRLVQTATA